MNSSNTEKKETVQGKKNVYTYFDNLNYIPTEQDKRKLNTILKELISKTNHPDKMV